MPELPEVEVLVRNLAPLLEGKTIRALEVRRPRLLRPTSGREFRRVLVGSTFRTLTRRGKYLVFTLENPGRSSTTRLLGHLGMTGRMYVRPETGRLPKHAAVVFSFHRTRFVFEDVRGFGRLTLDTTPLSGLGPEPLGELFGLEHFATALKGSAQPIKVKLLDQSLIAGVGNIYASESLFRAGISPRLPSRRLTIKQVGRLRPSLRKVLTKAIEWGSTVPMDRAGGVKADGLFCYRRTAGSDASFAERLWVYDREDQPCVRCGSPVRRIVQASRSTYYCPRCQHV